MHFNFPVTSILKSEINLITLDDVFFHRGRILQKNTQLAALIDQIGKLSAVAQGLPHPITASDKLKEDQILYLIIDQNTNNGDGDLIGLLKIGLKSLYLHDGKENIHRKECQCVLDFYIDDTKQRMGYGKQLFDYMLQEQSLEAYELPIDKPSPKLLQFLKKHYNLQHPINQNNKYVVYDEFFGRGSIERPDKERRANATIQNGRYTASKPQSTMAMILQNSISRSH